MFCPSTVVIRIGISSLYACVFILMYATGADAQNPPCTATNLKSCATWGPNNPEYQGYCCLGYAIERRTIYTASEGPKILIGHTWHCGDLAFVELDPQGNPICGDLVDEGEDCGGPEQSAACANVP